VAQFSFHVRQGKFSYAGVETVFENRESAQKNALMVFADLARDIVTDSTDIKWRMDVLDEAGRSIYRLDFSCGIRAARKPAGAVNSRPKRRHAAPSIDSI
jgi:uncharacterized protein YfcZ (UPF0381/DUF406 family)